MIWKPERKSTKGKLFGTREEEEDVWSWGEVKFSAKEKTKQTKGELSPNILCLGGAKHWASPIIL